MAVGNENWDRWIYATMGFDFNAAFVADPDVEFEIFIEGTHRGLPSETELLEFRMNGPQRRQPSRGNFILTVEINILVRSYMDDNDFHKMRRNVGKVTNWLAKNHCIFRYGDGAADDQTFLGELHLKNRHKSDVLQVNLFGQIDPKFRIEEATVEAEFEIHLNEGD
jgi:hypothetical protein